MWNCVIIISGEQCAIITGITMMPELFAGSLDSPQQVFRAALVTVKVIYSLQIINT